jgi:hypothetical protein
LEELFEELRPQEFHHGNAVGADFDAHKLLRFVMGKKVLIHLWPAVPEPKGSIIANDLGGPIQFHEGNAPLLRNRDIVDNGDELVACPLILPKNAGEVLRSGTWATVRYARNKGRTIHFVWPDGSYTKEENHAY